MTKNDIAQHTFQAIDIIVNKKLEQLQFDRCIIAKVIRQSKESTNRYLLIYQDQIFEAQVIDNDIIYGKEDLVYVLIPNGSSQKQKFILGSVQSKNKIPLEETQRNIFIQQEDPINQNLVKDGDLWIEYE